MKAEKDYEDLLRLFNKHKVKYCIVGAYAVAFYAIPRFTKDLDIFVLADEKNGKRIVNALNEFGFAGIGLKPSDVSKKGGIIQLGYEPVRIDIVTSISGCAFDEVWKNRKIGTYGREKVFFIGIKELISNKKSMRRKQDLADLEFLRQVAKHS